MVDTITPLAESLSSSDVLCMCVELIACSRRLPQAEEDGCKRRLPLIASVVGALVYFNLFFKLHSTEYICRFEVM